MNKKCGVLRSYRIHGPVSAYGHVEQDHDWEDEYEDHILMGSIYYGKRCKRCGDFEPTPPGPLELGIYK